MPTHTAYSDSEEETLSDYEENIFMVPDSQEYQHFSMDLLAKPRREGADAYQLTHVEDVEDIVLLEEAPQVRRRRELEEQATREKKAAERQLAEKQVKQQAVARREAVEEAERQAEKQAVARKEAVEEVDRQAAARRLVEREAAQRIPRRSNIIYTSPYPTTTPAFSKPPIAAIIGAEVEKEAVEANVSF